MKNELLVLGTCLILLAAAVFAGYLSPSYPAVLHSEAGEYTFVLDAGHGGEDGGALSAAGDRESDINLSVVLRLDQLMGFCGKRTLLVRSEDVSIHDPSAGTLREKKVSDLHNRVALVEKTDGALLLSIHQNSYSDSRYSGAQVFYGTAPGTQNWGESAQEILRSVIDPENRRAAKPVPNTVYLMNHITRPGILVECGFLSNREEAARLLTEAYQKQLALALTGVCYSAEQLGLIT